MRSQALLGPLACIQRGLFDAARWAIAHGATTSSSKSKDTDDGFELLSALCAEDMVLTGAVDSDGWIGVLDEIITRMPSVALCKPEVMWIGTVNSPLVLRLATIGAARGLRHVFGRTDIEVDASVGNNVALVTAASRGHAAAVAVLLDRFEVSHSARNNGAFLQACRKGHYDVVELLLARDDIDHTNDNFEGFQRAAQFGHLDVVRLLLDLPDKPPAKASNFAFAAAAGLGHLAMLRLLHASPGVVVDPGHRDSIALRWAVSNGHRETVEWLLDIGGFQVSARDYSAVLSAASRYPDLVPILLAHEPAPLPDGVRERAIELANEAEHAGAVAALLQRRDDVSLATM